MKRLCPAIAGATVLGMARAQAHPCPSRAITFAVPLEVGGSTDVIGRIMTEATRAWPGRPVVVVSFWHALAAPAVRRKLVDLVQEIFALEQLIPKALGALHRAGADLPQPGGGDDLGQSQHDAGGAGRRARLA